MYYQLKFLRCPELDLVFLSVLGYCCYVLLPVASKKEQEASEAVEEIKPNSPVAAPEEIKKPAEEENHVPIKYNVDFMRVLRSKLNLDTEEKKDYTITINTQSFVRHSPTPYQSSHRSPDPFAHFARHSPEPGYISRSPRIRLGAEEEKEFRDEMRERTPDFCPDLEDELPKDVKLGRVHYLRQRDGRIHVAEPVNGIRDIFFHLRDCELQPGEEIKVGDSVMFELSMFEGRLCAAKVKKTMTAIPSPEFSRNVLRQSKEEIDKIDALDL